MLTTRRREIRSLAEGICGALDLTIPVDLEEAVRRLGGDLEEATLQNNVDGRIEKVGDSFKITLSPEQSKLRKRFSLAHEIGHLFLHMGFLIKPELWTSSESYIDSVYYRYGYSEEEHEANEFAGSFLMPSTEFVEAVQELGKDGFVNLSTLAGRFEVSTDAAYTRGRWLGVFPWD